MTIDEPVKNTSVVPFVFRFAQRLPHVPHRCLRYDPARQISHVLVDGRWIDSPDVPGESMGSTRETRVRAETTDDE